MNTPAVRPLVPSDIKPSGQSVARAAFAELVSVARNESADATAVSLFPRDQVAAQLLQRAVTAPGRTDAVGWAAELLTESITGWLGSLAPQSAVAQLIRTGVTVPLDGSIRIPGLAAPPPVAAAVNQGGAMPVRALSFTESDLEPKKLGLLLVLSWELNKFSAAFPIFEQLLKEIAATSLDTVYFSTSPGSVVTNRGLLYGVTPITGSADMLADLSKLAAAVGANGSGELVLVASPGRSLSIKMRSPDLAPFVLASSAIAADTVVGLDPAALVHGVGAGIEVMASREATLHMSDTPLQLAIGAQGSAVVATPTQSMYQTAQIALRMLVDVAFCLRRPGAVAVVTGCSW